MRTRRPRAPGLDQRPVGLLAVELDADPTAARVEPGNRLHHPLRGRHRRRQVGGETNLVQRARRLRSARHLARAPQRRDHRRRAGRSRSAVASRRRSPSPVRKIRSSSSPAQPARAARPRRALIGRVADGDQRAAQRASPLRRPPAAPGDRARASRGARSCVPERQPEPPGVAVIASPSSMISNRIFTVRSRPQQGRHGRRPKMTKTRPRQVHRPARSRRPAARARLAATGRNDACPCGSGKKYKKCHLAADEQATVTPPAAPDAQEHVADGWRLFEQRRPGAAEKEFRAALAIDARAGRRARRHRDGAPGGGERRRREGGAGRGARR